MGRYISWNDVAGRYQDIARIAGAEGVGSYWLNAAEAEVDARLALRYTTPFTPTAPELVKDLCIDVCYAKMTIRQKGTEIIREDIERRFAMLIDGTMILPGSYDTASTLAWSEQARTGYHTAFGPDNELNWVPSSSWIADVEVTRS